MSRLYLFFSIAILFLSSFTSKVYGEQPLTISVYVRDVDANGLGIGAACVILPYTTRHLHHSIYVRNPVDPKPGGLFATFSPGDFGLYCVDTGRWVTDGMEFGVYQGPPPNLFPGPVVITSACLSSNCSSTPGQAEVPDPGGNPSVAACFSDCQTAHSQATSRNIENLRTCNIQASSQRDSCVQAAYVSEADCNKVNGFYEFCRDVLRQELTSCDRQYSAAPQACDSTYRNANVTADSERSQCNSRCYGRP